MEAVVQESIGQNFEMAQLDHSSERICRHLGEEAAQQIWGVVAHVEVLLEVSAP